MYSVYIHIFPSIYLCSTYPTHVLYLCFPIPTYTYLYLLILHPPVGINNHWLCDSYPAHVLYLCSQPLRVLFRILTFERWANRLSLKRLRWYVFVAVGSYMAAAITAFVVASYFVR